MRGVRGEARLRRARGGGCWYSLRAAKRRVQFHRPLRAYLSMRALIAAAAVAAARAAGESVALHNAAEPGMTMPAIGLGTGGACCQWGAEWTTGTRTYRNSIPQLRHAGMTAE